ncbi:MAG: hypothetical protein JST40_11000 [Armatimonadetes bacterium]|nr:hypothetical protein [Armatimonadota bacterium]
MRFPSIVFAAVLAVAANAQPSRDRALEALVFGEKPTLFAVVQRTSSGSDLIEISMFDPKFPMELLKSQCEELGRQSGGGTRGAFYFESDPKNPQFSFRKARFATENLIHSNSHDLNLSPIVKAFAGLPSPYTIKSMSITFQGEVPSAKTLRTFFDKKIGLIATVSTRPAMIEYRIRLFTQNPAEINIPGEYTPPPAPVQKPAEQRTPWLGYALLVVGSLAAGLLVYFTLQALSNRPSAQAKRR